MKLGLLAVLALSGCGALQGSESGRLDGTVRDGSDSVVPGTIVSCIQEETGFRFAVLTDAAGEYRLTVPEGHYKVLARRSGFRAIAQIGVFVPASGVRRLDFRLEPGGAGSVQQRGADVHRSLGGSDGTYPIAAH